MKSLRLFVVGCVLLLLSSTVSIAQDQEPDYGYKAITLKVSEDGSKYIRFINWHQFWLTAQDHALTDELTVRPSLRRSRFLLYAQISPKFLILTHFGINSLGADQLQGIGQGRPQLFMHDAWVEYEAIKKNLYVGGGLHYWNGISRLTNQSTLNFLPLDMPRFNWPTINTTDQFARHIGIYAKGKLGKLDYRVAVNEAMTNNVDATRAVNADYSTINAKALTFGAQGSYIVQGYFNYQFLDQESNKLPYMVGTYFGKKKVFNIGAGFYTNPNAAITLTDANQPLDATLTDPAAILADVQSKTDSHNVNLFGFDVFYDSPIGNRGAAITAYAVYYDYDFGPNFLYARGETIGSGGTVFSQVGFLTPGDGVRHRLQPYVTGSLRMLDQFQDSENYENTSASTLGVGLNYLLNGHNSKLTLEWQHNTNAVSGTGSDLGRLQYVIFL
ncbi:MAG: porin [Bacteroidota bacterium]